ncbi:MAG: GNAT family N-acetyltransferase [Candidatus Cloacimonetes bacterium]|nr:GNAT family N-acetyltransferase [Candidatus Cloacimonadota bacterium]
MTPEFKVILNDNITGRKIEDLRVVIGWDRMGGKYEQIIKKAYTRYSVRDGTKLIGYLSVISDGIADAFLVDLMVNPEYQGKEIGKQMVTRAILDLKEEGIKCIQVIFNPELESFYKQFGFHILKAGIIDNDTMKLTF